MSNRKLAKIIKGLFREIRNLYRTTTRKLVNWLLRTALMSRRGTRANAGFVLPTTVLLIMVVLLTVGALTFRAYNRNTQVIGESQQRVIYNAATPAIDRARAKIEFMFDANKDSRYPGGVPAEDQLLNMMLNRTGVSVAPLPGDSPYDLPDETRLDLNGGGLDNAWSFRTDTNGDGQADATVVYSVLFTGPTNVPATGGSPGRSSDTELLRLSDKEKADKLWIRRGPLSDETQGLGCKTSTGGTKAGLQGWYDEPANTSVLKKNFQVDAFVVPDSPNATAVTLEFQQDRQLNRGNKWGAWFRNDLEIYPGPAFNMNGAMHTEGSLIVGGSFNEGSAGFASHLISSPASCLYFEDASEITVTNIKDEGENRNYLGLVTAGTLRDNDTSGSARVFIHRASNPATNFKSLGSANDATKTGVSPSQVSINPETVLVEDGYANRDTTGDRDNRANSEWDTKLKPVFNPRIRLDPQVSPYVDDLYRADDRWGPKPRYDNKNKVVAPIEMGQPIAGNDELTRTTPPTADAEGAVGLDGYWERRARNTGMRVLVGERLELGNLNTWITPKETGTPNNYIDTAGEVEGDPLYPPNVPPYPIKSSEKLTHVNLHRRTLRDNLSAVQGAAIYHSDSGANGSNADYPLACLASTVHPGTLSTLSQSVNFVPTQFIDETDATSKALLMTDFFTGRGTNGWEFAPPAGSAAAFETAMSNASSPLRIALTNLANFAGDPDGAFPPKQDTRIHPYPALTMWGNYSNLRRALQLLDSKGYAGLSIADKTYLQTASCTLGMLAYNIDQIQKFDPGNVSNDLASVMTTLQGEIGLLMNGDVSDGEVLPKSRLASYKYNSAGVPPLSPINLDDYKGVPPEAFIGALREKRKTQHLKNDPVVRMAELIMLKYQVRRDRTFGFRPSPAFGKYNAFDSYPTPPQTGDTEISACDPDDFTFAASALKPGMQSPTPTTKTELDYDPLSSADALASANLVARFRLSRLCGTVDTSTVAASGIATVLPKFPALYYLFPETAHDVQGKLENDDGDFIASKLTEYDHRQPGNPGFATGKPPEVVDTVKEPYATDPYVVGLPSVTSGEKFRPVQANTASGRAGYRTGVLTPVPPAAPKKAREPYDRIYLPVPDLSVSAVALPPKGVSGTTVNIAAWSLPYDLSPENKNVPPVSGGPNVATNLILAPNADNLTSAPVAVGFLDRAFFDGRQLMATRTMDIDLGLLRSTKVAGGTDAWLPKSGIVYAFREDAVREDAIARPKGGTASNLTAPAAQTDPEIVLSDKNRGVSLKPIDNMTDPDRRPYGFRLRNGSELKRTGITLAATDDTRGLSFFSDQPVYIQGDFNLHQDGASDTAGARLEEFTEQLPADEPYTAKEFYTDRKTKEDKFADLAQDRWRPSEILSDSVTILSNGFCDGSIADTFLRPSDSIPTPPTGGPYPVPDFVQLSSGEVTDPGSGNYKPYSETSIGLFGPGCAKGTKRYTSFHNQNRPDTALAADTDWVRENSSPVTMPQRSAGYIPDFTSPIKISRAGLPLSEKSLPSNTTGKPVSFPLPVPFTDFYPVAEKVSAAGSGRQQMVPPAVRVNSIIVGGINPSRAGQAYGGLHNFPRFLENWQGGQVPVSFAGSFIQLSFSNYATAPFEQEAIEPGTSPFVGNNDNQQIPYYGPPVRLWGYDVALQFVPAGPAASRFVTASKNRNEYYSEPPANDPYINKLCTAVKTQTGNAKINCPT